MSTIIIRLQNLPLTAKAADIREFFGDLKIPKGSVNIVGGPMGDAFIGFASDEDARLAMQLDGRPLHNSSIRLMLSSKREMEQVIANAQAQAGKPPKASEMATANTQSLDQKNIKSIQQTGDISAMVPKSEVMSPSGASIHPNSFLGGIINGPMQGQHTALAFPPPQQIQEQPTSLSNDSWKTPQQKMFPSPPIGAAGQQQPMSGASTAILSSQMQSQTTIGVGSANNAIGGGAFAGSELQQQQPPPTGGFSFPPPSLATGLQQTQARLPFPSQFGSSSPLLTSSGTVAVADNFFNQPTPQHQQPASGIQQQQRFSVPPPQIGGQQSQFSYFGGPPSHATGIGHGPQQTKISNNNSLSGLFRQPAIQQQSRPQFNRRNPNQSFGQQRPSFDKFKSGQQGGAGTYHRPAFDNANPNFQQRFPNVAPQGQQQFADGFGGKRRRSRSPIGSNKRFNGQQQNFGQGQQQQQQTQNVPFYNRNQQQSSQNDVKGRFCIQLTNVPYKATFSDVQSYLSGSKCNCIKVTRVYIPDRDYSDRWIVEFDNENNAQTLYRYSGNINQRIIRRERIPPRRADEQYAVAEPERRDNRDNTAGSGGVRSHTRDDNRNRRRSRERDTGKNRDRSRDRPLSRDRDRNKNRDERRRSRDRPSSQESQRSGRDNKERSSSRDRDIRPSSRSRKYDHDGGRQSQEKQQRKQSREEKRIDEKFGRRGSHGEEKTNMPMNTTQNDENAFGAFGFSATQANMDNDATKQFGGSKIEGKAKPLLSFDAAPPQSLFFQNPPTNTTHRPPSLFNQFMNNNYNNDTNDSGANAVSSGSTASSSGQNLPSNSIQNTGFWSSLGSGNTKGTGANAIPVGQRPIGGLTTATTKSQVPNGPLNVPSSPIFSHYTHSLDGGNNSTLPALVIQEDLSSIDGDADDHELHHQQLQNNCGSNDDVCTLAPPSQVHQQKQSPTLACFPFVRTIAPSAPTPNRISVVSDQLPLDLLEPESCGEQKQQKFKDGGAEFSAQEFELRPHLLFLELYKQEPNALSCIRLENMPKLVFIEQLCDFLGAKITAPHQNIARMQNGVLYINLENEMSATKAAAQSGQFLYGVPIGITQLKKSEMADAIRQNMIIIREMYRVTVVARGFPLMVQPNEVLSIFERFNVNRDGVEKCAVKATDTHSTFLLTFPTIQDCHNAISQMDGTKFDGNTLRVFQPEGLSGHV